MPPCCLVIIHDFDIVSVSIPPCETNPELFVDPDAVLSAAVSLQSFQPEPWKPQVVKRSGRVEQFQPDARRLFNRLKSPRKLPVQQLQDIPVAAGTDHMDIILRLSYSRNLASADRQHAMISASAA